jgi:hypothetical protein
MGCSTMNTTEQTPGSKVTLLQFYSYHLACRAQFSPLHYGGKLFQQYIVDAYVKTEASRLDYIQKNQKALRVDLYQGLLDHILSQSIEQHLTPGKVVILPSSFHGSPRNMQQNYQDAMSLVCKFGKPDLFLTFTCNPHWPAITDNLQPPQTAVHRPDLVSRVFHLYLKELLHDITDKHVLGEDAALVYVIEFQKRGLPNSHMLIFLKENSKLREEEHIDSLICAEIPSCTNDPQLYEIVSKTMIHGPCGHLNPNSVCMDNGACTKDFPKEFSEQTYLTYNGYPKYRRRDNGTVISVGSAEVDNRYVTVPKTQFSIANQCLKQIPPNITIQIRHLSINLQDKYFIK